MKRIMKTDDMLYIHSMGKKLRITAIFTDATACNNWCNGHEDQGVIAEFAPFIFTANIYDKGI